MFHGTQAAPGGTAGTPITRMASSSSKMHLDRAFLLFAISDEFRHIWASIKEGESGEQHYYINDFLFLSLQNRC